MVIWNKRKLNRFRNRIGKSSGQKVRLARSPLMTEFGEFLGYLRRYCHWRLALAFQRFEKAKDVVVDGLYRRRGKYARPFVHTGMVGLLLTMMAVGPFILSNNVFSSDAAETLPTAAVLGATTMDFSYEVGTIQSEVVASYRGGEVEEYEVVDGDTVSTIAEKFGVSADTVRWANDLEVGEAIKVGDKLKILPVSGVAHKVKKGDTVFSVAKKYGLEGDAGAQAVVDYPFNEFVDDEKFTLAVGQTLIVPGGVVPSPTRAAPGPTIASRLTPDAGVVSASGSFVWPATGRISQGYAFYHRGIDIANKGGGPVVAADAGTVVVSGWPDGFGYGNRVVIDHGNGLVTLYAHLSRVRVQGGQSVNRGDVIGDMGSTGRSTGTHLHFEVRQRGGGLLNPLNFLK